MALPTVRAVGAVDSTQGNITPAMPTHDTDDILVWVVHSTNRTFTTDPPTGLTAISDISAGLGTTDAAGAVKLHIYWKRATSASESAVTFAGANGGAQVGRCMSIQGCVTSGDPWDDTNYTEQASASTSLVFPEVTTTGIDRLIVLAAAFDRDAGSTTNLPTLTNSNLASITERMDNLISTNAGGGIGCATADKASSGATGTTTGTITSSIYISWTGALKPASTTNDYSHTASGGFDFAGAANLVLGAVFPASGGIVFAGAASTSKGSNYATSGGAVFAGAATSFRGFNQAPSGGIVFAGDATLAFTHAFAAIADGGITFAGEASYAYEGPGATDFPYTASGGIVFAGQAAAKIGAVHVATGGIVLSGSAIIAFTQAYAYNASGGITYSGAANVLHSLAYLGSGGISFGGDGTGFYTPVPSEGGTVGFRRLIQPFFS